MTTVGTQPAVARPATALHRGVVTVADLDDLSLAALVEPGLAAPVLHGSYVVDVPAELGHIRTCVREAVEHAGGSVVLTDCPALWTDQGSTLGARLDPPLRAAVVACGDHDRLEQYRRHAQVPIVNAGSDRHHPLKVLADLLTIRELLGRLAGVSIAFAGPAGGYRTSLVEVAGRLGIDLRLMTATPEGELAATVPVIDPVRDVVVVDVVIGDDLPFGRVATTVHLPLAMTGAAAATGASAVEGPRALLFHRQESLQRVVARVLGMLDQAPAAS